MTQPLLIRRPICFVIFLQIIKFACTLRLRTFHLLDPYFITFPKRLYMLTTQAIQWGNKINPYQPRQVHLETVLR